MAKFLPGDPAAGQGFGMSVDVSDQTIVVGAPFDREVARDAGAAYIFEQLTGEWSQTLKLTWSSGSSVDNQFGFAVATDGVSIVVGAPFWDDTGPIRGMIAIYDRDSGGWGLRKFAEGVDYFVYGWAVDLQSGRAAVGKPNILSDGCCPVFHRRSGGSWVGDNTAGLITPDHGASIAIYGDHALAGDPFANDAAFIYKRYETTGTPTWHDVALLMPEDRYDFDRYFGASVAMHGDTAVVGAPGDDEAGENAGAVYVFRRVSDLLWVQVAKLLPSVPEPNAYFGMSVSLSDRYLTAGAPWSDQAGTDAGVVVVYQLSGVTEWDVLATLSASDAEPGDELGFAVSIDIDGSLCVIGAPGDDDGGIDAGAVYLFDVSALGPRVTDPPDDTSVYYGDGATLSIDAGGTPEVLFQWQKDGVLLFDDARISGSQTAELSIANSLMRDEGAYTCLVYNACGSAMSAAAYLDVICRADFDGNGTINTLDVLAFLIAFNVADPSADFDGNGTVNTIDFLAFLNAFNAGCIE
ncbi:MAG TPA: GC-type dockerin domain-anchored protein [Dehalococcoidia bacterium]|nr:GC-type dockerin domain-anchored protein [Dehalococcoidia bacterium]